MSTDISIIVPTYRNAPGLRALAHSASLQSTKNFEFIIVSNGAQYEIESTLGDHRPVDTKVVNLNKNLHFCRAVNQGVRLSTAPIIGIMNDDVTIEQNWTAATVEAFAPRRSIGSVASIVCQHKNPTLLDSAGNYLSIDGCASNRHWGQAAHSAAGMAGPIFGPSNSCAAYRRDAFLHAGGLDDEFDAHYEDIDLSFRMHLLGYEAVLGSDSLASHAGSATFRASEKAYLMERNYVWNLIKNLPTELWRLYYVDILRRARQPLPIDGQQDWKAWQKGKISALTRVKSMIAKRRRIQQSAVVNVGYIEQLLTSEHSLMCRL